MTLSTRIRYEEDKARQIAELEAEAEHHMACFEAVMARIQKLEEERFEDAMADDRSKEWREMREEQRKLESDRG